MVGGVTEEQKAEQLSGWLDVAVGVDQVAYQARQPLYCSTTPSDLHPSLCKTHHDCSQLCFAALASPADRCPNDML